MIWLYCTVGNASSLSYVFPLGMFVAFVFLMHLSQSYLSYLSTVSFILRLGGGLCLSSFEAALSLLH